MKSLAFRISPDIFKKFLEQAALSNYLRSFAPAFETPPTPVLVQILALTPNDLHNSEGVLSDSLATIEFHYDMTKSTLYLTILRKSYVIPHYIIEAGLREEIDNL